MANISWSRSTLLSVNNFDIFHTCQICRSMIAEQQVKCCKSTKFGLNLKLRMTVKWDKGQFEVIAKSEHVVRVIFNAQSEKEWNLWLNGFKRLGKFYFNNSRNYDPLLDYNTPQQVRKLKLLLISYLRAFNKPTVNYIYEMKCRVLSKAANKQSHEDRYFCVMARSIENTSNSVSR